MLCDSEIIIFNTTTSIIITKIVFPLITLPCRESQGTQSSLVPGLKYTFQIQARTKVGYGPKEQKMILMINGVIFRSLGTLPRGSRWTTSSR